MRLNLQTSGCWDIVSGEKLAPLTPDPFYTSYNKPSSVNTLRQAEAEYSRRDEAGNFIHSDDLCKDRVQEIKGQVKDYETYTRLREKAKNLIMNSMTKDLWRQRANKDDLPALWQELRDNYKAGVPELSRELAKYADMSRSTYPNPQTLLNALERQHLKIEVIFKAAVFDPIYLSWRYIHEMNKFKPLFDIPLAEYDTLDEFPPPDDVKRALEAHLANHSDISTVGKPTQPTTPSADTNIAQPSSNRKRKRKREKRDRDRDD